MMIVQISEAVAREARDTARSAAVAEARAIVTSLQPRGREALALLCKGFTRREAAELLNISEAAFDNRMGPVREAFGAAGASPHALGYMAALGGLE